MLTAHIPNYEKQSSYSITIVANSTDEDDASRRLTSRLDVTVNVVDAEDTGTVSLSQRQPQIGPDGDCLADRPGRWSHRDGVEWATGAAGANGD